MYCAQAARTRGLRADVFSRDDLRRVSPQSHSTKNQRTEVNCQSGSRGFKIIVKRPASLDHPTFPCISKLFRLVLGKPRLGFSSQLDTRDLCSMQLTHCIFPNENNKRKSVTNLVNERPTTEGHISFTTSCVLRRNPVRAFTDSHVQQRSSENPGYTQRSKPTSTSKPARVLPLKLDGSDSAFELANRHKNLVGPTTTNSANSDHLARAWKPIRAIQERYASSHALP